MIGTTVVKTRMAIVMGDVNCDGKVNSKDYLMIKRQVLGTYELDFFGQQAGNVNSDKNISAQDYMMIKRYVLGTYEF